MASAAAVVVAFPAVSWVAKPTVRPSWLTNGPLVRCPDSNAVSGSVAPSGSNGPLTVLNCGSWSSARSAANTAAGSDQTALGSCSTISVGLIAVAGKCAASSVLPAAESLPAGAVTGPPNPDATYVPAATASPPNTTRPMASTGHGRLTIRAHVRPHQPDTEAPARTDDGQNATGPSTASKAGSSVSPASSISPMPIDNGAASPEYSENVANASEPSAAISTPAENVIVSPTAVTARAIASGAAQPVLQNSRTRNMRNSA